MANWKRRAWCATLVALVLLVGLTTVGCSDDDDNDDPDDEIDAGLSAGFTASGTGAQADQVRISGATASGDTVTLEISCGGTTSTDVRGFEFDLVLSDEDVAEYVANSIENGGALGPDILPVVTVSGSRITVAVTIAGGTGGVQIAGPESTIVTMVLRVTAAGSTSITFENGVAIDSTVTAIPGITFDTAAVTVTGS